MNIEIIRTFVKLREILATNRELAEKLAMLEKRVDRSDETIASILDAIRQLIVTPRPAKAPIGFVR